MRKKNSFEVLRDLFFFGQVGGVLILIATKNNHFHQLQKQSLPPFNPITCSMSIILIVKPDMLTIQ